MVSLGADYSDARPGGAALAAAGVTAVGRYLAADGRGITAAEYQDLVAHGIALWLIREGAATGMLGGYAQGVADAQVAVQQIAAHGLPTNSVVYATADFDVQASQFAACDAYMNGFASVIGRNRTGIYGGLYYLNHCHDANLAVAFWECASTSFAHGETPRCPIHLQQTTLTPPVPGTDHNYIYDTASFAGLGATLLEDDLTPQEHDWLLNLVNATFGAGGPSMPDGTHSIAQSVADIHAIVGRPVQRDGKDIPQIQDNADTNTMVRQLTATVGALQGALNSVSVAGVDPTTIQAAAKAGAQEALATLVLKAT